MVNLVAKLFLPLFLISAADAYCLSVSGGGYRAMVGAIAFSKCKSYPGLPAMYAGTSGGAWGSYAVCRGANFYSLPTPKTGMHGGDAYKLMWKGLLKQLGEGYHYFLTGENSDRHEIPAVIYKKFRQVWFRNLVKVFRDVGVPFVPQEPGFNREKHSACVGKIIVTEGRTVAGVNDCAYPTFSYCRNFNRQLICDEPRGKFMIPMEETFRQAMITSSSAATTDVARSDSLGLVDIAKYKGPGGDIELPVDSIFENMFPEYEFFDVGACDNNPWPELLDYHEKCDGQIINLDMSGFEDNADTLLPSVNYARRKGWRVHRQKLSTPTGSTFGDKITLNKEGKQFKVLNLNPMSEFKTRMGEDVDHYLPTFPQTYKTDKVREFVRDISESWEHHYVQRSLVWLRE